MREYRVPERLAGGDGNVKPGGMVCAVMNRWSRFRMWLRAWVTDKWQSSPGSTRSSFRLLLSPISQSAIQRSQASCPRSKMTIGMVQYVMFGSRTRVPWRLKLVPKSPSFVGLALHGGVISGGPSTYLPLTTKVPVPLLPPVARLLRLSFFKCSPFRTLPRFLFLFQLLMWNL